MISPLIISRQLIRQDVPIMVALSALVMWLVQDGMEYPGEHQNIPSHLISMV